MWNRHPSAFVHPASMLNERNALLWWSPTIPFSEWVGPKRSANIQISGVAGEPAMATRLVNDALVGSDNIPRVMRVFDASTRRWLLRFELYRDELKAGGTGQWRASLRKNRTDAKLVHGVEYIAAFTVHPWTTTVEGSDGSVSVMTRSYYGLSNPVAPDLADNSPAIFRLDTNNTFSWLQRTNTTVPHDPQNNTSLVGHTSAASSSPRHIVIRYRGGWAADAYTEIHQALGDAAPSLIYSGGGNGYRANDPANDYEFQNFGAYFYYAGLDDYWGQSAKQTLDTSGLHVWPMTSIGGKIPVHYIVDWLRSSTG